MIAGLATLFASVVGITIGLLAGFLGGIVDKVLSFFIDLFLTVPFLLAALTHRADPQRPVRHLRQLRHDPEVLAWSPCWRSSAG